MNVLIACEESQRVCEAFRKRNVNAFSCDLIECSGGHPEWHIQGDVLPLLNGRCEFETVDGVKHKIEGKWDLIIAHPPCTYMSNAGACRMYPHAGKIDYNRFEKAMQAKAFFMTIIDCDCDKICVENPRPLKCVGLPKETQKIQPYEYGEPYSKLTYLWLRGLPPLQPTKILTCHEPWVESNTSRNKGTGYNTNSSRRQKLRSKTFPGIAQAMAEQWIPYIKSKNILNK